MSDDHWQLEGSAAELYQRYLVPAITTKWAEDLVDRALLRTGEDVLDVACGTGVVARLAAKKVATGHVTGLDLNAGMLAVARRVYRTTERRSTGRRAARSTCHFRRTTSTWFSVNLDYNSFRINQELYARCAA